MLGNELAVIITPHKIKLKMVDPERTPRNWDSQMFSHGNIYYADYANSIKPKYPDDEKEAEESLGLDLISSERYKNFMDQNLISDIIDEGQQDEFPTLFHVILILGFMQLATISILVWMSMG